MKIPRFQEGSESSHISNSLLVVRLFEQFLKEELEIEPEEFNVVLIESSFFLRYEYECSVRYYYLGIGYYRELKLYSFSMTRIEL